MEEVDQYTKTKNLPRGSLALLKLKQLKKKVNHVEDNIKWQIQQIQLFWYIW